MNYEYDLNVKANSQEEADAKAIAAKTLIDRLTAAQLTKLAHVVKNDKEKLAIGLQYLGA